MDGLCLGRQVRYVVGSITEHPARVKAGDIATAVVVGVPQTRVDGVANLRVLYDGPEDAYAEAVPYSEHPVPNSWHWPSKA